MARKRSRLLLTIGAGALLAAGLTYAFWPRPTLVDIGEVSKGKLTVTIDEEARTRVREVYVVSTPVEGQLLRVEVEPGVHVERGMTVVARMMPANPTALDARTREEAQAAISAAAAALRAARADQARAEADRDLAEAELARSRQLFTQRNVSQARLDTAERSARAARATLLSAEASVSLREAELKRARAQIVGFDDLGLARALGGFQSESFPIDAPATGRILRVLQQSETTLAAGTPIMEIGDIEDLEIVVELLSTDAVQVDVGDRVIIDSWGGPGSLPGTVSRIDPWGFTKTSALGVEEQRVSAIIRFTGPPDEHNGLGHGFRVEVRIVISEEEDVVLVPSNALFRDGDRWAVFIVEDGVAQRRHVAVSRNNGIDASIAEGLSPGASIILFPSADLQDGTSVAQR